MGYSRALRYACALAAVIGLTACDRQTWTRDEIADIAADAQDGMPSASDADMESEIAVLRARIEKLEADVDGVRALGLENADNADKLRRVVNGNADISNEEKVTEMTRRGACGTEMVRLENGGFHNRQIPCTLDDLR